MNRPEYLTKYPIPSTLIQADARQLKDDLIAALDDGQQLWLDLDSIEDFDLAGFNALVAPYYHSLLSDGVLYLELRDNENLMEQFRITRLDFILNTLDG